jgi:hypothetical protein
MERHSSNARTQEREHMTTLTHRRSSNNLPDGMRQFAESGNAHYGDHCWTLKTQLPEVPEWLVEFAAEYFETTLEEAETQVNPSRIVSDAGAWDVPEFVCALWEEFEPTGFRTNDGAIVLDLHSVELEYSQDDDE